MTATARVLCDSEIPGGHRLTTIEVTFHRFVLAEFNTHRRFSRNSASSRAIPFEKMLKRALTDTALPAVWTSEQPGMQGGAQIEKTVAAEAIWRDAAQDAANRASALHELGVHKSICNRLLEPFLWHTVIVTSTEWGNFFAQRCSKLAQPEIRVAAEEMKKVYLASKPDEVVRGEWHLPLIQPDERKLELSKLKKISVARCARVSYLTHDGIRDVSKDLELYDRLKDADPPHMSPFEHVARPLGPNEQAMGNFQGWQQLRHVVFGR